MEESDRPTSSDLGYLQKVELLAHDVVEAATAEGWLVFGDGTEQPGSDVERAVNALAKGLRFRHYDGDGCLDHD